MDTVLALVILAIAGYAILRSTTRLIRTVAIAAGVVACFVVFLGGRGDFGEGIGVGLVAAFTVALLLAVLFPPLLFVWIYVVTPPIRWLGQVWNRTVAADRLRRSARDRRRALERDAPVREKAAREWADAQRRRADARAACEVFYSLHAPEIGPRFGREAFADFVARHLGDEHPPEDVERRAGELLALLRQHLRKVLPPLGTETLDEILAAFDSRIRRIRAAALDERDKEVLVVQLEQEREDAVRRAVREGRL